MRRFAFQTMQSFLFIAIFLLPAFSNIHAATLHIEDSIPIDNSEIHFELQPDLISEKKPDNKETKQTNLSSPQKKQTSENIKESLKSPPIDSFNLKTDNQVQASIISPLVRKNNHTQPLDIIKQSYGTLDKIIDDEALDDTVLIILEMNTRLNRLDEQIEQRISPAIEEAFIMQQLSSTSGGQGLFISNQVQNATTTDKSLKKYLYSTPKLKAIPSEEETGFFGFLLTVPKYFFNLENIFTLLITLLLLTGFVKALSFVLNRVY